MAASILGEFLRRTRKEKGLSLKEVAKRAHIDFTFLSEIERGKRNPSGDALGRIAASLSLRMEDLSAFDSWTAFGEFRQMLEDNRNLSLAFVRAIRKINSGACTWRIAI